ncbi:MAG: G5 domain-containing protein, partial [Methanothrix sp.]
MLSRLKVQLAPEDKVFYFPDPSLGIGSQVLVYRAQVFLVQDGNSSEVYRSWASSIGELLQEKGIAVTSQDQIVPSVDTVIQYSSRTASVSITRVSEEVITTYQSVPYQTKTVEDPQLERGKRVTEVAGVNGKLAIQFLVRRENGVEVSKKESQREVL